MKEITNIGKKQKNARKALNDGRYNEAAIAYKDALKKDPQNVVSKQGLFDTLRLIETDKFLINRYLKSMGFSKNFYQGFSSIQGAPSQSSSAQQLTDLSNGIHPDDDFPFNMGVVLAADDSAQKRPPLPNNIAADDKLTIRDHDTVDLNLISAQALVKKSRYNEAIEALMLAVRDNPNSLAYKLLAKSQWHCGFNYKTVLMNFTFTHVFPTDHWGGNESFGGKLRSMGQYGKFKTYYYITASVRQFYAVPIDVDARLGFDGYWANETGKGIELYAPRISYPLRQRLKLLLPPSITKMLQWVVSLKILTLIFSGRIELDNLALTTTNINELLDSIKKSND